MRCLAKALLSLFCCCCVANSLPIDSGNVIDLTHEFANGYTITWPTVSEYNFSVVFRGENSKGIWYEANDFSQAEHSGTHVDAPAHFGKGKWRMVDIPVERLIAPGIVIDISKKTEHDRDAQVTVEDILRWEKVHGRVPEGAVVIMFSGMGHFYGNRTAYFGWPQGTEESNPTDTENLHFPGFSLEAAEWLTTHRSIFGTGVDTPSTDYGQSKSFESHQKFASYNIWGLENLNNVDKLPPKGFTIFNMAYKSKEGSGGPTRVVALLDKDVFNGGCRKKLNGFALLCSMIIMVLLQM